VDKETQVLLAQLGRRVRLALLAQAVGKEQRARPALQDRLDRLVRKEIKVLRDQLVRLGLLDPKAQAGHRELLALLDQLVPRAHKEA
jgi:hypothetical protein